jgi:hypothetical protein
LLLAATKRQAIVVLEDSGLDTAFLRLAGVVLRARLEGLAPSGDRRFLFLYYDFINDIGGLPQQF